MSEQTSDTVSDIQPESLRNARKQLRTGAGEIDCVQFLPTFKEGFGRSENLMSDRIALWANQELLFPAAI
jgi:hypothetical protein